MQKQKIKKQTQGKELEEIAVLKDNLARVLADYDNLVKRQVRERDEIYLRSTRNLVEELLPVLDDFERANEHLQDQGLKLGVDHFRQVLDNYGVIEIKTQNGDSFQEDIHEAIDSIDQQEGDDLKSNTLAQIFTKGYKWKDGKVLRPAKVQVIK